MRLQDARDALERGAHKVNEVRARPTNQHPQAVTPVPERMAGTTYAYRGQETHGVPQTGSPDLDDSWEDDGVPVEYVEKPKREAAQPVRIVSEPDRNLRRFRTLRGSCPDTIPQQIIGQHDARTSVTIRNLSTVAGDRLWIGDGDATSNPLTGFPLDPGAQMTIGTECEVYAQRDPAAPTPVVPWAAITEYTVSLH